jgi:hypothetical protein
MVVTDVTPGDAGDLLRGGRFRNPLPLSNGGLVASHTSSERAPGFGTRLNDLRLNLLEKDNATGLYKAGRKLTSGITKSVHWWGGTVQRNFSGELWELEAVEVRPHARPTQAPLMLEAPERAVFAEESVSESDLRTWLIDHNLALIVTRDQTSRDQADRQQPFNLQVPGGRRTLARTFSGGRVYDIAHFQVLQGRHGPRLRRPGRTARSGATDGGAACPQPRQPKRATGQRGHCSRWLDSCLCAGASGADLAKHRFCGPADCAGA